MSERDRKNFQFQKKKRVLRIYAEVQPMKSWQLLTVILKDVQKY